MLREHYIEEARIQRLEQAAWTIIYRYEKLLHDAENKDLEQEIAAFGLAQDEKLKPANELSGRNADKMQMKMNASRQAMRDKMRHSTERAVTKKK